MIPVGDSPRSLTTPFVNYALIIANIAVFAYMLTLDTALAGTRGERVTDFREQTEGACFGFESRPSEADRFYCEWGFQPGEFFDTVRDEPAAAGVNRTQVLLSLLTSVFVHGGWLHIIGNMLFLWVFGDNVEDRLGHLRYLLFYLAAALVASLVQAFADTESLVPVVGASGAVAGVLGAYLISYPKATVKVVIPFFILIFIPIPVPAILMIGIWFLQNLLAGVATISDANAVDAGVAWFAHIGGFLFGIVVTLVLFGGPRRDRAAPRYP